MYIEITIDVSHYESGDSFDLRLSNYHTIKQLVDLVWQLKKFQTPPRQGYWVRISNKRVVLPGNERLVDAGVLTGDRIEIL
ncbi:ubiquitin [Pontibacillus halophilus JSM 076056 = DSM 19796]|uniref:Ubiquitin n=1 Tax=Pontibacillus halophilus JSM 076056 = DSM 19796 TaxID=1385510 RepID=A0A0A5GIZ1_9BACI|nr:EsaB/YukD family protein [Pontibacillus halophilus]KGX91110.1 ubiquitin [Pontibacillus halophilus JSM 076056 = DSM 19796]